MNYISLQLTHEMAMMQPWFTISKWMWVKILD